MIEEVVTPAVLVILFLLAVVFVIAMGLDDAEYYKQIGRNEDKTK